MVAGDAPMKLIFALGLAIALLGAFPAAASPLDDAKQAGHVGEQADGYVAVRPGAPSSAQELVNQVNTGRSAHYAAIAAKNGTDPAAVAALAGSKLIARTPSGQWVRDASGAWRQK